MSNTIKLERQESELTSILNGILLFKIEDTVMRTASITFLKLKSDMSAVKVYIDCRDRTKIEKVVEKLNKNSGLFRSLAAEKWKYYKMPKIIFAPDTTIDYAKHIDDLLKKSKGES